MGVKKWYSFNFVIITHVTWTCLLFSVFHLPIQRLEYGHPKWRARISLVWRENQEMGDWEENGRYFYIVLIFFLFSFLILFGFRGRRRGRGGRGYPMSDKTTPTAGRLSTWGPHMNSRFPLRFFTLLFSSPPVFRFSLLNYPHSPSFFSDFFLPNSPLGAGCVFREK